MISTTIFTLAKNLAIPRTLTLEKREGEKKILLDTTKTIFYPDWQCQLQTVFEFVQQVFGSFHFDFLVSVDSPAVDGWSTSVPLFLLFASILTGEPLPRNVFSTGCMFAPDGWVSHGKPEGIQAKIEASEVVAEHFSLENPKFLIPYSYHQYKSRKVQLHPVRSMFSALEIALPQTFRNYRKTIEPLLRAESQENLRRILGHIPEGDALVIVSAEETGTITLRDIEGIPLVIEEVPPEKRVYLYFLRDRTIMFKYSFSKTENALKAASEYRKVLP